MSVGTLKSSVSAVCSIEQALNEPMLRDIGDFDKQKALVLLFVTDIYRAYGRNFESSSEERELFSAKFANKYAGYTIGDIKVFSDMVIDSQLEIRFLSVIELFAAWKKYLTARNNSLATIYKESDKNSHEAYMSEKINRDNMETAKSDDRYGKIISRLRYSLCWWEDFLRQRPDPDAPFQYDKNGVNIEYAQYREMRMKELSETYETF